MTAMSDQDVMSPEEARDLQTRLARFAEELTPSQFDYFTTLLTAGAASDEVSGYMIFNDPGISTVGGGVNIGVSITICKNTSDPKCKSQAHCSPS